MLPLLTPGCPAQGSREKMAQIKRSVRPEYLLVFAFIFLCRSPHCQVFILPQQDQQCIWHTQSLQNIQLSPLSPAIDFATFFTNKLAQSVASSQLHKCRNSNQPHLLLKLPPCLLSPEVSKLLFSSYPTTCPLDPIPSHLLKSISPSHLQHSHISSTHLSLQAPSPMHSSRLRYPHC